MHKPTALEPKKQLLTKEERRNCKANKKRTSKQFDGWPAGWPGGWGATLHCVRREFICCLPGLIAPIKAACNLKWDLLNGSHFSSLFIIVESCHVFMNSLLSWQQIRMRFSGTPCWTLLNVLTVTDTCPFRVLILSLAAERRTAWETLH